MRGGGKVNSGIVEVPFEEQVKVSEEWRKRDRDGKRPSRERRIRSRGAISVILIGLVILPARFSATLLLRTGRGGSPPPSHTPPLSRPGGKVIASDQVFMAVKTTPENYYAHVQSILDTYWRLVPRSVVFFTDSKGKPTLQSTWQLRQMDDPPLQNPSKDEFNLVDTGCGGTHHGKDLSCKTGAEIRYYARHSMDSAPWFCQFDDDTFVNVPNMLSYLAKLDADSELLYIGRKLRGGQSFFAPGAAWCLSRALVRLGRSLFEDLGQVPGRTPWPVSDDMAIGYIIHVMLNVTMVDERRMRSHLEKQQFASQSEMKQQLTYGSGGKRKSKTNYNFASYPGVSFVGKDGGPPEDPLGFRGLFCNLWPEECLLTNKV